jgi:hypothetical protein
MNAFDEKLAASGFNIHYAYLRDTYYNYLLGISDCTRLKLKTSKLVTVVLQIFSGFSLVCNCYLLIYDCEQQKIKAFL